MFASIARNRVTKALNVHSKRVRKNATNVLVRVQRKDLLTNGVLGNGLGHISRDCDNIDGKSDSIECYKCGNKGHIARYCTAAEGEGVAKGVYRGSSGPASSSHAGRGALCYSCGSQGKSICALSDLCLLLAHSRSSRGNC